MIRWALKQYLTRQARQVQESMRDPHAVQRAAFVRLREALRGSVLSVQSGFDRCRSLEECRRLPDSDSDSLHSVFKEAFQNGVRDSSVFGRTPITGFARTSGSLGDPKDIPMNQAYLGALDRSLLRVAASYRYTTGDWDTLLAGRRVVLGSRPLIGTSSTGLPVSDVSGLIPTRTWMLLRRLYVPRHDDLWIEDWSTKADLTLKQAYGRNVVSILGIPALAMDFARRAMAAYGVCNLSQLWPNLNQYYYGGVHLSAELRREIERSWFDSGRNPSLVESYFATEAPLAFSFDPHEEGLALNSLDVLFLFRRCSDSGEDPSLLFAHELAAGDTYSVQVITPGGLINYRMGDRITVLSTQPLRILVAGREQEELSMTGENITLGQIDLALNAAGLTPARLGPHRPVAWVDSTDRPRLVWGIPELAGDRLPPALGPQLDAELCRLNGLYAEALTHEHVIAGSRVISIPRAVFERYEQSALGIAQFKPRRVFASMAEFAAVYQWQPPPVRPSAEAAAPEMADRSES